MIVKGKSMYMIMPAQKMYIKYSGGFDKMMNSNQPEDENAAPENKPQKKLNWKKIWEKGKTNNTKTILGYKCTEFVLPNDDGSSMHIWATTGIGNININMMQNPMSPNPIMNDVKNMGGYFPMLTEQVSAKGKIMSKLEVMDMKEQKLDDKLFTIPSGYKQMKM